MKHFKVVGWYVDNPHDELSTPYALVVRLDAETRSMAFDDGETQLRKLAGARQGELLNWYVKEEKPCLTSAK